MAYRGLAQARVGALATRERSALRAILWLGRACPVEFRLGYDASEFPRQELREEHSRFTRRLCLTPQLSGQDFGARNSNSAVYANENRRHSASSGRPQSPNQNRPEPKTECSSRQCSLYKEWHKSFVYKNVILSEESGPPAFLVGPSHSGLWRG